MQNPALSGGRLMAAGGFVAVTVVLFNARFAHADPVMNDMEDTNK